MAVLVEGTTVVVRNSALEKRFPGGVSGFQGRVSNNTYRSDGILSSVSFMVPADAHVFARALSNHGFCDPSTTSSDEIAIIDQSAGFLTPCDWLDVDLRTFSMTDGRIFGATAAWIHGEEPPAFAASPAWHPQKLEQVSQDDLEQNYEVAKVHHDPGSGGVVIAYRHRETGRMLHIGRPAPPGFSDLQERCSALGRELAQVVEMPSWERRAAADSLCNRAREMVEETNSEQPGPLFIEGIAARLAGRWSVAEPAFRKVTALLPDRLDGWLELTQALGHLDRLDEAEAAARQAVAVQADSPAALGNLASALLQRCKPEAALPFIERALALDPSDKMNQRIREKVRDALHERVAECDSDGGPWYRRWFR
jgi:hypothetical protein